MLSPSELTLARQSPAGFAHVASGGSWEAAAHLNLVNRKILAAIAGTGKRQLMIFMPPRSGKSELVSRFLPAWYLGRYPQNNVILCSYEATFAAQWGAKARDLMIDWGPAIFGQKVRYGTKAPKSGWEIAGAGGTMFTAGAGGPVTGKGGKLLVLDDVVKNAQEANSRVRQEAVWDWYRSTFLTRQAPDRVIILMMTRWSQGDLAGRLLEHEADGWDVIRLPAFAEDGEPDALGREPGEALWPKYWPADKLLEIKESMGAAWFSAMYQQRPVSSESAIFQRSRFRYFRDCGDWFELLGVGAAGARRVFKSDCFWFQTGDFAHRVKTSNDYTAIATLAVTEAGEMLLVDMVRERIEVARQWPRMKALRAAFPRVAFQAVEAADAGFGVIAAAANDPDAEPLRELRADRDKVTRAMGVSVAYEAGRVFHLEDAPWLADFEAELMHFPVGRHDDQVDVLAYGWICAQEYGGGASIVELGPEDDGEGGGQDSWTQGEPVGVGRPRSLLDGGELRRGGRHRFLGGF